MGLGVKFFIIQLSAVILFETTNILLSKLFGPLEVTNYNIAFKYFSLVSMVFSIILVPFWSAFTESFIKHDYSWINRMMKNLIYIWLAMTIFNILLLIAAPFVYRFWVGSAIKISWMLSLTCSVYMVIYTFSSIFVQFIIGVGKIMIQLIISVSVMLINIPLSIFLAKGLHMGPPGIVTSNMLCILIGAVLGPIQYYRLINSRATGLWAK